ncbi:hypothetical protein PENANT_c002G00143 [Penicillium antarcticum]|uniref:Xylanolytic transcriptional activator regulatory domain-containing protein n=1 Tax=Penicillium antarcticum TaxID=416450 RepID=A0A1V6QL92_9EURO|nr:hypothetical protein PENANT_c002G00143 [Penicillium antarcticum]
MSEAFFHTCKPALDVDYLEDGDLALVQTFLIIAHYLQGSRAPNRCWHIIGTAIRLAQGVGLHSDIGDEHRSFAETQIRRRVWHGCVMLDLAVSIMLGRPVMISHKPSTPLPDPIDDRHLAIDYPTCEQPPGTFSHVEWFIATLKLYGLLRKTLHMLYDNDGKQCNGNPADQTRSGTLTQIQYITQLDSELQDFRLEVPMPLHWDVPASEVQPQFLREQHLLKARQVKTGPLPVLSKSLHENLSTGTERASSRAGICANFAMDCVFFCVQSAIELINLIHETCNTDLASVWYYNIFCEHNTEALMFQAD